MDAPEASVTVNGCRVKLLGTIPGFVPDGERVSAAISSEKPDVIALGVPDADLDSMEALIADPTLADGLEPDELDLHFLTLITEWGATQFIPSPDLHVAHTAGIKLKGIDLSDDVHTQLFTDSVKLRHLLRRTAIRKRLLKEPLEAPSSPYALALEWDKELRAIRPIDALEQAREHNMAEQIRLIAAGNQSVLVVVHAARLSGLVSLLTKSVEA